MLELIIEFSGWFLIMLIYFIAGILLGNRMAHLWGFKDDLRWVAFGIVLSIFVAYPATFYIYYTVRDVPTVG